MKARITFHIQSKSTTSYNKMSDPRGNGPQKRQEEENDDYDDQSMVEGSFDAGSCKQAA